MLGLLRRTESCRKAIDADTYVGTNAFDCLAHALRVAKLKGVEMLIRMLN